MADQPKLVRRHAPIVVAALSVLAYLMALGNGFAYDDVPIVVRNPAVAPPAAWWRPWLTPYWPGTNEGEELDVLYRPLPVQTYAWERRLAGSSAFVPHLTNVLLHTLVSVALWSVARRMGLGAFGSLAAGAVFAVHPIHTEAVANVVGRAELLSALGLLGALIAEDQRMRVERAGTRSPRRRLVWTVLMLATAAIALFSKESGIAVLVILPGWRWLIGSATPLRIGEPAQRPHERLPLQGLKRTVLATGIPLLVLVLAYLAMRYEVCAGRLTIGGSRYGPGNFLREAAWYVRLWTPPAILGRYVVLMLYPATLLSDYSLNVILPNRSPFEPHAVVGLLACALAVAVAVRTWRRDRRWVFLLICFAASYALVSNAGLRIDVLFAERLFYAPSLWICLALGGVADALIRRGLGSGGECDRASAAIPPRWLALLAAVVLALGLRTAVRNPQWHDTATLAMHDLGALEPGRRSAHLCYLVGREATRVGDVDAACSLLTEAVGIFPDYPDYLLALGEAHLAAGRPQQALAALERAGELAPRRTDVTMRLQQARVQAAGEDPVQALAAARAEAEARPADPQAVRQWALRAEAVELREARRAYQRLVELDADRPDAWNDLARICAMLGERGEAIRIGRQVAARWPQDFAAHANLAVLLMDRTDREHFDCAAAEEHARTAVRLQPTHWNLRVNLAEVLAACGKSDEAAELFEDLARQCEPGSAQERQYRQRARELRR